MPGNDECGADVDLNMLDGPGARGSAVEEDDETPPTAVGEKKAQLKASRAAAPGSQKLQRP
jgi:hypothetical protein